MSAGHAIQWLVDDVPDHAREQLADMAGLDGAEFEEALQELLDNM